MIVVIGAVFARGTGLDAVPGGLAAGIALAAAAESRVELVARIGDDPAGDAVLLALAAAGVGHVATLRDPARATPIAPAEADTIDIDPDVAAEADISGTALPPAGAPTLDSGDVDLALRYLTDFRAIVVVHPTEAVVNEVIAAADYAGTHLVIVADPHAPALLDLPDAALVVGASDDAAGFGDLLGRYVAAVDRGEAPATAFAILSAVANSGRP